MSLSFENLSHRLILNGKKNCGHDNDFIFDWIIIKHTGNHDSCKILDELEFWPHLCIYFGVTCPWTYFFDATCPKLLKNKSISGHASSQVSDRCPLGCLFFILSKFCWWSERIFFFYFLFQFSFQTSERIRRPRNQFGLALLLPSIALIDWFKSIYFSNPWYTTQYNNKQRIWMEA